MRFLHAHARTEDHRSASDVLGERHPVAAASERVSRAELRATVNAFTAILGSAVFALMHSPALPVFALAGALISLVSVVALGLARGDLHAAVMLSISTGDDHVGTREFDVVREQLADSTYRRQLARRLARRACSNPSTDSSAAGLPAQTRAVDSLPSVLIEMAALIRGEPAPSARTIAICTALAAGGVISPLHCADANALERELRRIRFHAYSASSDATGPEQADVHATATTVRLDA